MTKTTTFAEEPTTNVKDVVIAEDVGGCFRGCFGGKKKQKKKPAARAHHHTIYHAAVSGRNLVEVQVAEDDSMAFFDAAEDHEDIIGDDDDVYQIVTTTKIYPHKRVSMLQPETLLSSNLEGGQTQPPSPEGTKKMKRRLTAILDRMSSSMEDVEEPRIAIQERGFPGSLTKEELDECLRFSKELSKRDRTMAEIVYDFRDFEEEPYALCRFLRAVKFDGDAMLERLERTKKTWEEAKKHDFYKDIDTHLGCSVSLFLRQYPFINIGRAKNGCPVNWFQAGKINPEGIFAITTIDRASKYFWYQVVHVFKQKLRESHEANPDFVRMEGITVIDLKGLSSAALVSETFEVIKAAGVTADFFVESLHCMVILNAPTFFSFSWGLIKKLIDPRTAKRIQVFAKEHKGMERIRELIEESQIPTDYGGTNTSIAQTMVQSNSSKAREEVTVLNCKKRSKISHAFSLKAGETATLTLHTRSCSTIQFDVLKKTGEAAATGVVELKGEVSKDEGGDWKSAPTHKVVVTDIAGPGDFVLEGQDLDDATREQGNLSRGHVVVEMQIVLA